MQKCSAGQPWHQRSIFHGVPEPETAPPELVVSPIRTHGDTGGKEHPSGERPRPNPSRQGSIDATLNQRRNRKRKCNRKTNIAEVQQWRMNGEANVLQNRIQITPLEGGLLETSEWIGSEKNEQIESAGDPRLHRQHIRLQCRGQVPAECADQSSEKGQYQYP